MKAVLVVVIIVLAVDANLFKMFSDVYQPKFKILIKDRFKIYLERSEPGVFKYFYDIPVYVEGGQVSNSAVNVLQVSLKFALCGPEKYAVAVNDAGDVPSHVDYVHEQEITDGRRLVKREKFHLQAIRDMEEEQRSRVLLHLFDFKGRPPPTAYVFVEILYEADVVIGSGGYQQYVYVYVSQDFGLQSRYSAFAGMAPVYVSLRDTVSHNIAFMKCVQLNDDRDPSAAWALYSATDIGKNESPVQLRQYETNRFRLRTPMSRVHTLDGYNDERLSMPAYSLFKYDRNYARWLLWDEHYSRPVSCFRNNVLPEAQMDLSAPIPLDYPGEIVQTEPDVQLNPYAINGKTIDSAGDVGNQIYYTKHLIQERRRKVLKRGARGLHPFHPSLKGEINKIH